MSANSIVLRFVDAFESIPLPYMLVGSYSSNLYGRPRLTQDADFVMQCDDVGMNRLRASIGSDLIFETQIGFETVTGTTKQVVRHTGSGFKVELFQLSDDPHDKSRFSRRCLQPFEGRRVWLPSVEDVVITKLRWSRQGKRQKDVDDIVEVLEVQLGKLDVVYIRSWCDQHGTRELFDRLLAEAEEAMRE